MSWNHAYLDAVDVPRWVPRDLESTEIDNENKDSTESQSESQVKPISSEKAPSTNFGVKALVNNPKAKFAILVNAEQPKTELQKAWKQLKFAWQQWHNQEFPASLFQLNTDSEYSLAQLEQQNLVIIDTTELSQQVQKISASKLLQDKKSWWYYLQQVAEKSQLF